MPILQVQLASSKPSLAGGHSFFNGTNVNNNGPDMLDEPDSLRGPMIGRQFVEMVKAATQPTIYFSQQKHHGNRHEEDPTEIIGRQAVRISVSFVPWCFREFLRAWACIGVTSQARKLRGAVKHDLSC